MKKQIDIRKKFNKKQLVVSKDSLKAAIDRKDGTIYLEEETHYDNGESEFIYRLHILDNFK